LAETASLRHFAPDFSFFHRIQRAKALAIWHVGCVQCCDTLDRVPPAIVDTEFKDFGAAVNAPAKFINRPEQHGSFDPESRMPPTPRMKRRRCWPISCIRWCRANSRTWLIRCADLPRDVTRSSRYRLSVFDAEQKKRDEIPDKNFTISAAAELQTVGNRTWALFDLR
jgi:hypothetical protein